MTQEKIIDFSKDTVKDMLEFAVEREYYEKAAILRDYLKQLEIKDTGHHLRVAPATP